MKTLALALSLTFVGFGCFAPDSPVNVGALVEKAEKGDADAQNEFGLMCANGLGAPQNDVEAYKWFLLSMAQGNERARKNISIIEPNLIPTQIAEGQRLAAEFKPKKTGE